MLKILAVGEGESISSKLGLLSGKSIFLSSIDDKENPADSVAVIEIR